MASLDEKAQALYDACPTAKPSWDQLGDVTKDVWRERVELMDEQQPLNPEPGSIL